jgi:hypothetical protein
VRDGWLAARPSFWQLTQTRKARARGEPCHLVVHEDVLVFTKPLFPASSKTNTGDVARGRTGANG